MANLLISYDLYRPGQNYDDVAARIKELGSWAKVQQSFWYVDSGFSAGDAADYVREVMDTNDSLFVANATNGEAAWYNLSDKVSKFLEEHWT